MSYHKTTAKFSSNPRITFSGKLRCGICFLLGVAKTKGNFVHTILQLIRMLSNSTNKINNLHRIGTIVLKYVNGEVQKTLFDGKKYNKKATDIIFILCCEARGSTLSCRRHCGCVFSSPHSLMTSHWCLTRRTSRGLDHRPFSSYWNSSQLTPTRSWLVETTSKVGSSCGTVDLPQSIKLLI